MYAFTSEAALLLKRCAEVTKMTNDDHHFGGIKEPESQLQQAETKPIKSAAQVKQDVEEKKDQ